MDRNDEIGGLWLKESQKGTKFMSGTMTFNGEKVEVVVFKNSHKQPGEKTPDYRVYRSQPRDGGGQQPQRQAPRRADDLDDEIPF